jgi:ubiquinone/menaquinone biosynthesis C-methylase UbiE
MNTTNHHLFSMQSNAYHDFRPTYDVNLFAWLAKRSPDTTRVWDCGCGSGQASADLAGFFQQVVATDVNEKQLSYAKPKSNVVYRREPAETSSLGDRSVDLTVVAQALHWFDVERFYTEVRRVSKPGSLLAVISYNLCEISPTLDALIKRLYTDVVGPYWAPERTHVETGYRTIPFPFRTIEAPQSALRANWTLNHLLGYLKSWSAVGSYIAATKIDPVEQMRADFEANWGDSNQRRTVEWPLTVKVGLVDSSELSS